MAVHNLLTVHILLMTRRLPLLLLLAALLLPLSSDTQAQTPTWQNQFYFNAGPQFVTGDFSDAYKTGLAIDAGYYYRASSNLFLGVAGGYHQFAGEPGVADLDIIPLHLAAKYNFTLTGVQPYIGAEGGLTLTDAGGESETNFGIAPRVGLRIPLSRGFDLDINGKYNVVFQDEENFTYIGLNGGPAYIPSRTRR
jgi:hypothetical protein